jgi:hypothetical protein
VAEAKAALVEGEICGGGGGVGGVAVDGERLGPTRECATGERSAHSATRDAESAGACTVPICRMDHPGPTTSVGTRTDYSVGPWDYPTCAARYLMA